MPVGVYEHKKGWHHSEETRQKIKLSNTGKKPSEETIKKMVESKKKKPTRYWLGKKRPSPSLETRQKMSITAKKNGNKPPVRCGESNNKWKGGISKLCPYKHYRNKEYIKWRKEVFERDNYTCERCGIKSGLGKGVILHPHHKKSYTYFKQLRYELSNGVTLCICCHKKEHSMNGYKNHSIKES